MSAVINFFRSRHLERIDYVDIIMFFQQNPNCKIITTDEEVQIFYDDPLLGLSYPFYITKRSRVTNISDISAEYLNIRFLVEIPLIIPEQVARNILTLIDELCQKFQLVIYYDGAKDAVEFDVMQMLKYLETARNEYLAENPEEVYFTLSREVISHVCNYHQIMPFLSEKIKEEVKINKYILLSESGYKDAKLAIEWAIGTPLVFPPHLDYIKVVDLNNVYYVPANYFYKLALRKMYELKNYIPDASLLMLCGRSVKGISKKLKKFKKVAVDSTKFSEISITNLIEKED